MVRRAIPHPARVLTLAGLVVAAAALVAVITFAGRAHVRAIAPTAPLAVSAELTPATAGFGDRVVSRVVIALDARAVVPGSLRYGYSLTPLTPLGPDRITRSAHGALDLVTIVQPLACMTAPCLSRSGPAALRLPAFDATVARIGGGRSRVSARWPTLSVRGRAVRSDLSSSSPSFAVNATPPSPRYRFSPATLAALLEALAACAALGAVGLLTWQGYLLIRRRSRADADALGRAIALTREAQMMAIPQRRRAVGLLARLLSHGELSSEASALAWSEHEPESDELQALATAAERERS